MTIKSKTAMLHDSVSSRIAHLDPGAFSTNYALSDGDRRLVGEALVETESCIQSLDKEIVRLQEAISRIQQLRAKEVARISRLQLGIAPHRRVPPEILAKIFLHCAVMQGPEVHLPPLCGYSIWAITQICSRWREIAFSEPLLWNDVKVKSRRMTDGLNHLVHDVFLHRGGEGIIRYNAPPIYSCREWEHTSSLLAKYPRRLREITLDFFDFIPPSFSAPCALFDDLQSLTISFGELRLPPNFENMPIRAFSGARSLKQVSIRSEERNVKVLSSWSSCISFPWAQLTHLTIEAVSTHVFVNMLEHCVQLVVCRAGPQGSLSNEQFLRGSVFLENLHSMYFSSYSDYSAVVAVLDLLIAPTMKKLEFALPDWEEWPQRRVLSFIDRSNCDIETFKTPRGALVDDEIIPLMRAMPHLTELSAHHKEPVSDSTLDTIVAENLCPNLRTLKGLQVASVPSLARFMSRRRDGFRGGLWDVSATAPFDVFEQEEEYYEILRVELRANRRKFTMKPYFEGY